MHLQGDHFFQIRVCFTYTYLPFPYQFKLYFHIPSLLWPGPCLN